MIEILIHRKKYSAPSNWTEVTFDQWERLQKNNTWKEVLQILTNIPAKKLEQVKDQSIGNLISLFSWLLNSAGLNELPLPIQITINRKKVAVPQNICEKTWGQKIAAHTFLKENNLQKSIPFVAACYLLPEMEGEIFNPDEIEKVKELSVVLKQCNLFELYAVGNNYCTQLLQQIKLENKLLGKQPKPEHLQAGIKMFDKFGVLNTIDALAGGDVLKYKPVQQIEYNVIFSKLLLNQTTGIYQENLQTILRNRK